MTDECEMARDMMDKNRAAQLDSSAVKMIAISEVAGRIAKNAGRPLVPTKPYVGDSGCQTV